MPAPVPAHHGSSSSVLIPSQRQKQQSHSESITSTYCSPNGEIRRGSFAAVAPQGKFPLTPVPQICWGGGCFTKQRHRASAMGPLPAQPALRLGCCFLGSSPCSCSPLEPARFLTQKTFAHRLFWAMPRRGYAPGCPRRDAHMSV